MRTTDVFMVVLMASAWLTNGMTSKFVWACGIVYFIARILKAREEGNHGA